MLDSDDTRVQVVRDKVLAALDAAAAELYPNEEGLLGATDSELPNLFRALDIQAGRLCSRAVAARIERENKRNHAFRECPILCGYVSTALQDLQFSENDEACTESREPRDSGTIYTLPAAEFAKAQTACVDLWTSLRPEIEEALALTPGEEGLRYANGREMTLERIGSTFYLARVGHGVTFTDDGDAPCLQALADYARNNSAESPYFGDDGRVYGF